MQLVAEWWEWMFITLVVTTFLLRNVLIAVTHDVQARRRLQEEPPQLRAGQRGGFRGRGAPARNPANRG